MYLHANAKLGLAGLHSLVCAIEPPTARIRLAASPGRTLPRSSSSKDSARAPSRDRSPGRGRVRRRRGRLVRVELVVPLVQHRWAYIERAASDDVVLGHIR